MNNADEILLIVLAVVIIIFFLLVIWALVYLVKILKDVKVIVNDAKRLINSAEAVGEAFKNVSGPIALVRLIRNLSNVVSKERRKNG